MEPLLACFIELRTVIRLLVSERDGEPAVQGY